MFAHRPKNTARLTEAVRDCEGGLELGADEVFNDLTGAQNYFASI